MNKPELLSTIVHLRAYKDASNFGYLGRQVQAWFLREVRRQDISLADHLHDEVGESEADRPLLRPYTLSTLYKGQYPAREVRAGDWCWIRITSLTQPLTELLINNVLPDLVSEVELGSLELKVEKWVRSPDLSPVIGETTYADLMHQAITAQDTRLEFDFLSPTTFRQKNPHNHFEKDVPLPLPDRLFGSYLSHWCAFSGAQIAEEYGEFIEECLVVNELTIRSERVQFSRKDARDAATGFIGQVRFAILGNRNQSRFGSNWEHYANLTGMLSRYAFYCGSGRKTTRGLGQTNPIFRSSR